MLMEEGKDTLFGGVKDKISNYISKDLFEVNDKGWQDKQKQAIYSLSDVSADFSIDLALSGPFALMKGAKNLGKANKKFDESLKENNVNSDTIANSNADLKRNEHSLNNKNSSDGVGVASNKTGKAALDRVGKKSSEVTSDITRIDNSTSNTNIKHNGNSGNDGIVVAGGGETTKIKFGSNENQKYHAERHIKEETNLDIEYVKKKIKNDFIKQVDKSKKSYSITIDGYKIEYRPFKLQDGSYNIGRITVE